MSWVLFVTLFVWGYASGILGKWALDELREDDPSWTDYPASFALSQVIPIIVLVLVVLLSPFAVIGGARRLWQRWGP